MNAPATRTLKTMCPMNCHPTLCGMEVTVEGDKFVGIKGDATHPDSKGALCMRGQAAHEIVGNDKRLTVPLMRDKRGGELREATWDEAYARITAAMGAVKPHEVAFWGGHGLAVNDYGVSVKGQIMARFAHLYGAQIWGGPMICWGLGGFGFGITGAINTSTLADMEANAELIIMWGTNSASQANTVKPMMAAKKRGAHVVNIDIRRADISAFANETLIVKPGSDAALALAMMNVIITEGLGDEAFIAAHTVGYDELVDHVAQYTPDWAAGETGLDAEVITALARRFAATKAATIVAGGSSMHKSGNAWKAARAIACLPGLTGAYGQPGGGMGVRHGVHSHGRQLNSVVPPRTGDGPWVPDDMEAVLSAMEDRRVKVMLTFGSNMLSSFADAGRTEAALVKTDLFTTFDIFLNETGRAHADIILPSTIWLEELGCKATGGHIHLSDTALSPAGEARPLYRVIPEIAGQVGVADVYPWDNHEEAINAVINNPSMGNATVAKMRENGGRVALNVSASAYDDLKFDTPSGKIEFLSDKAAKMGLPTLPVPGDAPKRANSLYLAHGRAWTHFHAFYNHGRALPTLAERDPEPELWISPSDAADRGVEDRGQIRLQNGKGAFDAVAKVTDQVPDGTVWMHDGWFGLNVLTESRAALPVTALRGFPFTVGQSDYQAEIEVTPRTS